jgi:hypothetical protein
MNKMEDSFLYNEFTVYVKKDVIGWRANSIRLIKFNGKDINIQIDEQGNTKAEAIEKAKREIDRQLKAMEL